MTASLHRTEVQESPNVRQAKQLAREAGSTDNNTINWALALIEQRLAFENRRK